MRPGSSSFATSIVVACPHLCSSPPTVPADSFRLVDQMWSKSLRGRCWVHRMRNFASKVPKSRWHEIKPYLLMIRDAPDLEAGQKAVREFLAKFSKEFPGLCKCLTEDLDALLAQLQLPWRLRKFTRTTNLIERSFVEERRNKTLPRFFTEKSCLKLVYAVLIRAAARWQAISITSTDFSSECSTKNANSLSHRTGRLSPNAQENVHAGRTLLDQDAAGNYSTDCSSTFSYPLRCTFLLRWNVARLYIA